MPEPSTHEAQVQFLLRIQRLLNEGSFTATYKYALLLSLADIAVESGDNSGAALVVPVSLIAERYIAYYWRHAAPYVPQASGPSVILRQNTDRQAAIVTAVADARRLRATLAELERDRPAFRRLIARVNGYFWEQPLWRLQRIGNEVLDFLYENREIGTRVETLALRPGVAFCLRRFHGMLRHPRETLVVL